MKKYFKILILLTVVIVAFTSVQSANASNYTYTNTTDGNKGTSISGPTNGLVGYWSFNGADTNWNTNTVADLSGNNNTGNLVSMSTTTSPVPGVIGQALKFDGANSKVTLDVPLTDTFTVSTWFKINSIPDSGYQMLVGEGTSKGIFIHNTTKQITFYYSGSSNNHFNNTILSADQWYHLVVINDGGNVTFFLNGVTDGTSDSAPSMHVSLIGNDSSLEAFNGLMDDVRVYSRALSASEITQLYNLGKAKLNLNTTGSNKGTAVSGPSNGLVGYWSFNGPDMDWNTNTAKDVSGNNNTGTLVSMSTTTSPVAGEIGQALSFDGSGDYISLGGLTLTNTFTVSAWVNVLSYPTTDGTLLSNEGTIGIYLNKSGKINYYYAANDHFSNTNAGAGWHHVAIVNNGGSVTFYLNGTADGNAGAAPGFTALYMGWDNQAIHDKFNGYLDEVRIYNRALSQTEITQLYNLGKAKLNLNTTGSNKGTAVSGPSSGLVGYWSFNGPDMDWNTNTAKDVSGNNNTGTLVSMSTTTSPVPGVIGQALKFDGTDDFINLGGWFTLDNYASGAVSVWFKPDTVDTSGNPEGESGIFSARDGVTNTRAYIIQVNNGLTFGFADNASKITDANSLTAGNWYHAVMIWDGTNVRAYVNGEYVGSNSYSASAGSGNKYFDIGAEVTNVSPWATDYFDGQLDDVKIFNYALTSDQVKTLYNNSSAVQF